MGVKTLKTVFISQTQPSLQRPALWQLGHNTSPSGQAEPTEGRSEPLQTSPGHVPKGPALPAEATAMRLIHTVSTPSSQRLTLAYT